MKPVYVDKIRGYLIGDNFYKSKADIVKTVRAILHSYEPGATVSKQHFDFLIELFSKHPRAKDFNVDEIKAFDIRIIPNYEHTSGFWVIMKNGTAFSWSYTKLIYPPKPLALFRKACRATVADQMLAFKMQWFKEHAKQGRFICVITGETVLAKRAHVDHEPPSTFDALVRAFVKSRSIDLNEVSLIKTENTGIGYKFADASLASDWQSYHRVNAKLRVISDTANLSDVRKLAAR